MKRGPVTPPYSPGRSIRAAVFVGWAAISTAFVAGCGGSGVEEGGPTGDANRGNAAKAVPGQPGEIQSQDASSNLGPSGKQTSAEAQASKRPAPIPRKIIYDARIDLVVESLSGTEHAILRLINEHNGFLAESDQSSVTAFQRKGTWRVRVPIDHFSAFVSAVSRLGEVRQNHVGSQDVTEEFFDLEARIRNKREEEKRLLKHLADSTGKLKDILEVEKELSRVRGEVEQMEGRLRFLANRTELSTITIEATEWKDYKPPVAATFQTQIGRTFFGSYEGLVEFGKVVFLVLVALTPWIPLIVLGLFVLRWLFRFGRSRSRSRSLFTIDPNPRASS